MRRGTITVECDDCGAEVLYGADDFEGASIEGRLTDDGWRSEGMKKNPYRRDICDQCVEDQRVEAEKAG